MLTAAPEAPGEQSAGSLCLTDLPRHVLAAIAALLSQRDRVALASCTQELAAAAEVWWHTLDVSLTSQAAADSLGQWLRRHRPAVASLCLQLAARDSCTRRAIELQLPEDAPCGQVQGGRFGCVSHRLQFCLPAKLTAARLPLPTTSQAFPPFCQHFFLPLRLAHPCTQCRSRSCAIASQ